MLGGYGVFGSGAYVEKTFDLSGAPEHSAVRVQLDFVQVDWWNGEFAYLLLGGEVVWSQSFSGGGGSQQCGGSGDWWKEQLVGVEGVLHTSASSVTVRVETDLNEAATDEAWGIQSVRVSVFVAPPLAPPPPSPPRPPPLPPLQPGSTLVAHDVWPGASGWSSNAPLTVTTCGEPGAVAARLTCKL